jgi:hypothetical protein
MSNSSSSNFVAVEWNSGGGGDGRGVGLIAADD